MGRVNRHHLLIVSLNGRSSDIKLIHRWLVQKKQNEVFFNAACVNVKHYL